MKSGIITWVCTNSPSLATSPTPSVTGKSCMCLPNRLNNLEPVTSHKGRVRLSRQILLTYDLCIRLPVPAGMFSRGPRGCQAHSNRGVVKYHTLRLPDPNSSVIFSDESDELGWLIRIWMSPIERLIRKRRSPPNPDEPNWTRPKKSKAQPKVIIPNFICLNSTCRCILETECWESICCDTRPGTKDSDRGSFQISPLLPPRSTCTIM